MISVLRSRWARLPEPRRQQVTRIVRGVLATAIIAYLAVRLSRLGWSEVVNALPRSPWFYLIFLLMYFTLPLTEAVAYSLIWNRPTWQLLPATLRKRVYNREIAGLSGEISLYFWARRTVDGVSSRVFHGLRDNTIVASVASVGFATTVLVVLLVTGTVALPPRIAQHQVGLGGAVLVMGSALITLAVRYRKSILVLSRRLLVTVGLLHLFRLSVIHVLQVVLWAVAIPGVALNVWLTFLAMQIVVTRLPVLPSRDLVFVGVGIEMSRGLPVPEAAIAGLLLVTSGLDRLLNVAVFGFATLADRVHRRGSAPPAGPAVDPTVPPPSR